jgi:hypothetical protein
VIRAQFEESVETPPGVNPAMLVGGVFLTGGESDRQHFGAA